MSVKIIRGDCIDVLRTIDGDSINCCVTSPPYWGLRDYGVSGQLGMEATVAEYVEKMVAVFREVRRVLRDDGTLWLNLGDSYYNGDKGGYAKDRVTAEDSLQVSNLAANFIGAPNRQPQEGLKPKDLCGIPWRVALALQADGWYLRQDIIWAKPNPMPESVRDRCTKSHEYIFLLAKSERYYFDAEAIAEPAQMWTGQAATFSRSGPVSQHVLPGQSAAQHRLHKLSGTYSEDSGRNDGNPHPSGGYVTGTETRNKRSVWTVATHPFKEAHFATFPPALIEPCILAGCPRGGVVLDPFGGAGTTGLVADRLQRDAILIELNLEYVAMAEKRIRADAPLFTKVV